MTPPDGQIMDDLNGFNAAWEANAPPPPDPEPQSRRDAQPAGEQPFHALGHDRGRYYFLPSGGGQIVDLSARDLHNAADLCRLASRFWWESAYPGGRNASSFDTNRAGNEMMRLCEWVGIFDRERIRGRGIWLDEGRVVMHLGGTLRVDGREMDPAAFDTRFIYERARAVEVPLMAPLDDRQARRLIDLCCAVGWEDRARDGRLLAGFLVVAMLCGGMPWRPHLWVTGESGEGKSWVFDNIVKPVIGTLSFSVQGNTSEAGIRGTLGGDARPVLFDEAEPDEDLGAARMQQVLHLARQASSEDGGAIVKGTKDGGARHYRIRSCFIFSSINLSLKQAADESRFLVLNLAPGAASNAAPQAFEALRTLCAEVMTADFPAQLLARSLRLLPTIRANAETLARAIARLGNSRRTGDTLGVVLAGAFSLTSERTLTATEADSFLAQHAWIREAARAAQTDKEWFTALQHLVQAEVALVLGGRPERRSVSELIGASMGRMETIPARDADPALRRCGLLVKDGSLLIANQSDFVAERFRATRWAAGWGRTIARATGASKAGEVRYHSMFKSRSLSVPLRVLGEDDPA